MKKMKIIFIISIVIVFLLIFAFIQIRNNIKISYDYNIEINIIGDSEYELFLPLVISDDKSNLIVNKSNKPEILKGIGTIKIGSTNYGYAYHINAKESLSIKNSKEYLVKPGNDYNHYLLSLENKDFFDWNRDTQYWYYASFNKSIRSIEIMINFNHITKSGLSGSEWHTEINFNGHLSNGWNLLNATIVTIV